MDEATRLAGKTAIARKQASVPARLLQAELERTWGIDGLKPFESIFDYGCGKGADIRFLSQHFSFVDGWDPVYKPEPGLDVLKMKYGVPWDYLLMTYVLNVLPKLYRIEALEQAANFLPPHGQALITVRSKRSVEYSRSDKWKTKGDMFVTQRGTMQRGFTGDEVARMALDAGFEGAHIVRNEPVIVLAYHKGVIESDRYLI